MVIRQRFNLYLACCNTVLQIAELYERNAFTYNMLICKWCSDYSIITNACSNISRVRRVCKHSGHNQRINGPTVTFANASKIMPTLTAGFGHLGPLWEYVFDCLDDISRNTALISSLNKLNT